ncbi:MAG: putative serine/threonine protein phosphatase [Ilumatobacteraceae bacterium]|nr:putative serine/threonine protein phosphatase [Ilumatobacteraceae bacterium]
MGDTTPTSRPAFAWGASTHPGRVREENEDSYVAEPMVLGIADGMGGHQAGEVASQLAVDILRERLGGGAHNLDVVVAAVVEANVSIFQSAHSNASQRGMGTTLTAIALLRDEDDDELGADANELVLVNVGDSRAYVLRNGLLRRASIDHSYVQELVATGHITESEARTHPRRNIVTRALGIEPNVRVDTWRLPLVRGDRYVLCSDGLVDEVDDDEIEALVNRFDDPQEAADELVTVANRHGGRDNVTVIVVDVLVGLDPPAGPAAEPSIAAGSDAAANDDGASDIDIDDRAGAGAVDVNIDDDDTVRTTAVDPDRLGAVATGSAAGTAVDSAATTSDGLGDAAATITTSDDAVDPTTALSRVTTATSRPDATSKPRQRKMTLGMFLFLLALAAIVTVTVVLLAVAVRNGDDNGPTPTVPATSPVTSTVASSTVAPTTAAASTTTVVTTTTPTTDAGIVTTTSAPALVPSPTG